VLQAFLLARACEQLSRPVALIVVRLCCVISTVLSFSAADHYHDVDFDGCDFDGSIIFTNCYGECCRL
jgi:hypothetical protein